jgi:trehalose-phosphatase
LRAWPPSPPAARWARIVDRLVLALRSGRPLLVVSDFDGALVPLVADPSEARLPPQVREDLRTLATTDGVTVAVLSGRGLDDLRGRVGLSSVVYGGCHGLEMAGPGMAFCHAGADARRGVLADVARELRGRLATFPGVLVEAKGLAVTVHYRHAGADAADRLAGHVRAVAGAYRDVTLAPGRKAFELLPVGDWDRGRCIAWLETRVRARAGGPVATVYLGDAAAGEDTVRTLHGRAITVMVGARPAVGAAHRVPAVHDVHRVIAGLADHLSARAAR